jgi:hypothetical protein
MHDDFTVDIEKKTVTHKPTKIVFTFVEEPGGTWYGEADRVPTAGSVDAMAKISRRAGEAWLAAISAA